LAAVGKDFVAAWGMPDGTSTAQESIFYRRLQAAPGRQAPGAATAALLPSPPGLVADLAGALFGLAPLIVSNCTFTNNQPAGGGGGADGNGGNGIGGGLYNDGQSSLTVRGSNLTANEASGGAAGTGGNTGQGRGGGLYLASGGVVCIDVLTSIFANTASTSNADVFGSFASCP
jgi:hypothetical protein